MGRLIGYTWVSITLLLHIVFVGLPSFCARAVSSNNETRLLSIAKK
jgi:hypothetical protein